jgi:alkylation response protein AidB-like acyl-CoA dehydrogenase
MTRELTAIPDLVAAAAALAPLVAEHAAESERERRLAGPVVEGLRRSGLFHAAVPRALGGLEVEPAALIEAIETLSRVDGSTGWVAMIGSSTGLVSAYLEQGAAREVFGDGPGIIAAGVVAPRGELTREAGGYRMSGRWPFASGCLHAEWIGLTCRATMDNGDPDVVMAFVPMSEVEIIDTWSVSGLRATGSHDIRAAGVRVPAERAFSFAYGRPRHSGLLYGFSMRGLLSLCVASVALGIARGALDDIAELTGAKTAGGRRGTLAEWGIAQAEYAKAEGELRAARALLYETLAGMCETLSRGDQPAAEQRALVRLAASQAVVGSVRAVDIAYGLGGGSSIYETSLLQGRFRDIHTLTQHMIINVGSFEGVGRGLLGLDAPPGFL